MCSQLKILEVYSLLFNSLENNKGDRYNIVEIIVFGFSLFLFLNFCCYNILTNSARVDLKVRTEMLSGLNVTYPLQLSETNHKIDWADMMGLKFPIQNFTKISA